MARRRIGQATVVIDLVGEKEGRAVYAGRVSVVLPPAKRVVWRFDDLRSPAGGPIGVGGVRLDTDSSEALDEMARAAVTFAAAVCREEVDDLPPEERAAREEVAAAIEDATAHAMREDGNYEITDRS